MVIIHYSVLAMGDYFIRAAEYVFSGPISPLPYLTDDPGLSRTGFTSNTRVEGTSRGERLVHGMTVKKRCTLLSEKLCEYE